MTEVTVAPASMKWTAQKNAERARKAKAALDSTFLKVSHVKRLLSDLDASFWSGREGIKARHLVIFGDSGAGKTRLLEVFASLYPREELEDRTLMPVLFAKMPSNPTPRRIVVALLKALGSIFAAKGKEDEPMVQLKTLCKECGVRIILIDEASHLVDRGREKTHYRFGDALKEVVDELGIPTVLTGVPRLERLFAVNEQLRGRFSRRRTIRRFSIVQKDAVAEFRSVVHSLSQKLEGIDSIELTSSEFLPRIHAATHGLLRPLIELLKEAVDLACMKAKPAITADVLIEAFRNAIWESVPDARNPFHQTFSFLPLDGAGEPYDRPTRDQ